VLGAYHACVALAGRSAGALSRFAHLGAGSSLPGRLVQALDPRFLGRWARTLPDGSVVVSGTNGKTTTASMLQSILRAEGVSFVANRSGANLRGGVVSAFLRAEPKPRMGVFEVDEAAAPSVVADLRPRLLVLTNVFRDQLDRFGEPERVAAILRRAAEALPEGSIVIANADDPVLSAALEGLGTVGFSVLGEWGAVESESDAEPEACFRCGGKLRFERRTMANLGSARCDRCGWESRPGRYAATLVLRGGLEGSVVEICDELLTLPLGGIHNVYNAAAAMAAACELGISPSRAIAGLEAFQPRFGRAEYVMFEGTHMWLALVKNPAGAGVIIREVCEDDRVGAVVVAISDRDADGRDVSWIWDVDFERFSSLEVPVVAAGTRAADAAVRLKYAGRLPVAIQTAPLAAVRAAIDRCRPDGLVAVLATYTAMLGLREVLTGDRSARVEDGVAT
jgi:UDP-N-acetylmuramyl tripeptide synthase